MVGACKGRMEERDKAGSAVPRIKVLEMRDLGRRVTPEDGVLWGKGVLRRWGSPELGAPTGEQGPWDRERL